MMNYTKHPHASQRGFSQGSLIWLVVIFCLGALVKSTFFPSISKGSSLDDLMYQFGQPVAKTVIPRPG